MKSTEINELKKILAKLAVYYRTDMREVPVEIYENLLAPYPIDAIASAAMGHMRVCKFFPKVCELIEHMPRETAGARTHPSPNEAWAIALQGADEGETVATTAEILEAFSTARAVLGIGDEVGARMAFLEAYRRLVADKPAPVWFVSAGHDPARRDMAVQQAVKRGRLPAPVAETFRLPAPSGGLGGLVESAQAAARHGETQAKVAAAIDALQTLQRLLEAPADEEKLLNLERLAFEAHRRRELARLQAYADAKRGVGA